MTASSMAKQPTSPLFPKYLELFNLWQERGAGTLAHPGGTLAQHLDRTGCRLASWGASIPLIAAGYCHAAYGTTGFPHPLLSMEERKLLRNAIGSEAEMVVYAYCCWDRTSGWPVEPDLSYIVDRFTSQRLTLSTTLQHQFAELTVANELDIIEQASLSAEEHREILSFLDPFHPYLSAAGMRELANVSAIP
jgi:hypothetical protein